MNDQQNHGRRLACDVCVIGTGMAGQAATLFAARRGLRTVQVGAAGEIIFATGLVDLMGVHPIARQRTWSDPWAAIRALSRDVPQHPYARLRPAAIEAALFEFLDFLAEGGLVYMRRPAQNVAMPTPVGTVKLTHAVPATMWPAVEALEQGANCVLVDVAGLNGFSARLVAGALGARWPSIRTGRIHWPGQAAGGEVFAERLARALALEARREELAARLRPLAAGADVLGLPAVLGIENPEALRRELAERIGCAVFEMPTLPLSIPGLRLKQTCERGLAALGAEVFPAHRVTRAEIPRRGPFRIGFERLDGGPGGTVEARHVILATGRFLGGGLRAERTGIVETLFGLPVVQPEGRAHWHRREFLDPAGHPVNLSGLAVDDGFRPLDRSGRPAHPRLHAAGGILAHQDWMRMKCGAGLAVATAHAAVTAVCGPARASRGQRRAAVGRRGDAAGDPADTGGRQNAFKTCPACGFGWQSRTAFLDDPRLAVMGYQVDFEELKLGLFLFNHDCAGTLAVPAGLFVDLYDGPVYEMRKADTEECPGHCLRSEALDACPVQCECAWVREVLQVIRERPR